MTRFEDTSLQPLRSSVSMSSEKFDHPNMSSTQDDGEKSRNGDVVVRSCSNETCKNEVYRCTSYTLSWSILPLFLGLTSAAGFVITYFFAKSNCHLQKWILPYLSYTGTEYPESMIFGLILNTEGFLGLIVAFLAWRYYQHMGQSGCFNHITLLFGGLSCFGVIMVGNFQVTKAQVPHYIGAGLAFIVGTGYGILSSVISRRTTKVAKVLPKFATCVTGIRIGIATVMVISLICLTGVGMSKNLTHRNKSQETVPNATLELSNTSCQGSLNNVSANARSVDLLGAIIEWLLTACLLICLSLYAYEFRTFRSVKVVLQQHDGPLCARHHNGKMTNSSSYSTYVPASSLSQGKVSSAPLTCYCKNEFRDQHRFVESRCDFGESKLKSSSTSLHSLTKPPCHNTTIADSGIGDDVPLVGNNRLSASLNFSQTIKHSCSMPNITAVETV